MNLSAFEQVYGSTFSTESKSASFRFDLPQASHVRMKAVLRRVSRQCQFGVLVCDEQRQRVELDCFSSFKVSFGGGHWYELREHKGKINKLFVGPQIQHVKEALFCFSPKPVLHGKSVYFRVVCFEKGKAQFYADSKALRLAPSVFHTPAARPRTVERQSTGVWAKKIEEKIEHTDTLIEIIDEAFEGDVDMDFDLDAFIGHAHDSEKKVLQDRVLELETELEETKAKFFTTSNRDESKRCDKCFDVISLPYCRSIFWVHREQCFEKYHCRQCESKAKELRRKLVRWYWKDGGAHDPHDYAKRVAFTIVDRFGETQHRTVEDLSIEFDKPFYA